MHHSKLGRAPEDDRDHFGKKRLDLAGPLLGGLFRVLFRKLTKDVRRHLQRCLDEGKHFNIGAAIKSNHISFIQIPWKIYDYIKILISEGG